MRSANAVVWIAAALAGGCGRIGYDVLPITSTDAGHDAGSAMDAGGTPDAGAADSGTPVDAGGPDLDAAADATIPPCSEDPCKLVIPQCGCPEGEACQRTRRGEAFRECVPPGDLGPGEACTQSIECVTGHTCVGFSPDGICSRYCTTTAECGAPESECTIFTAPSEGVGACTHVCDPVLDSGCPAGYGCHLVIAQRVEDDGIVSVTVCGPGTGPAVGEACDRLCAPGGICLGNVCYEVCAVGDASTCSIGGATCGPFGSPMVIAGVEYGYCQ